MNEHIKKQLISNTLVENYMPYAMSVIVSRAIPELDGFKPSHRKLLYTMYKMGLLKGQKTKSANVVGQTMKLNPHGDAAIYETMVRLTRGYDALILPYIDSKGNFGKSTSRDMAYAASRYTEVKLEKICSELFASIDEDAVDFVDNYDATMKEPILLPVTFPNVLVNANKGIAVGMASSIPSFNLGEVIDFTRAKLKDAGADPMDYLKGPDFSTGGFLLDDKRALEKIYRTGIGSVKLRAKYVFDKKNRCIEIVEIPYTTTVEAIMDKIISEYKKGSFKEIVDIRDETDLKGLKIAIDVKKSTDVELLMEKLYSMTPLEDSFSCNLNLLVSGLPMVLGVGEIVDEWIKLRLSQIVRRLNFKLDKLNHRLHLLKGLEIVLLDIDRVIEIIRSTEDDKRVVPNLMEGFGIDEIQANYVAEIKLRNLNKEYLLNSINDIVKLKAEIDDISATINSDAKLRTIIEDEISDVKKKYATGRKTIIIDAPEKASYSREPMIDDYNLKLFLTADGYLKKISLNSLKASSVQKLKDGDRIISEVQTKNVSDLLVFTDKHNVHIIKVHEIPDCKASELGSYIYNIMGLESSEKPIFIHATSDYKGHLLFAYEDGKLAKVTLSSYAAKQYRKKLLKAYSNKSKLVRMMYLETDTDIVLTRCDHRSKNVLLISTSLINEKASRSTMGVNSIRLKKNSYLSSMYYREEVSIEDLEYYRADNIPSAGKEIMPSDHFAMPEL